jgi:hypothetical protein
MSLVIVQGGLSERQERSSKEVMHAIEQKLLYHIKSREWKREGKFSKNYYVACHEFLF